MSRFALVLVLALLATLPARATPRYVHPHAAGLGLSASNLVSGVSGLYVVGDSLALQAAFGGGGRFGVALQFDAIWRLPPLLDGREVTIVGYPGVGTSFSFSTNDLAFAGVVGVALGLKELPLEFAFEVRPTIVPIDPSFRWGLGGAVRWYFN